MRFSSLRILSLFFMIVIFSYADTNIPEGNVFGEWTKTGSPYLINGDITIPAGETLTIEPGVVVKFQSWYKLTVNGYLEAVGTASERILFTATEPGPGEPGWVGIDFIDAPDYSHLEYVTIENGKATAGNPNDRGGALYIINSNPIIKNTSLRNNQVSKYGGAIYMEMSNPTIENCTITDNSVGFSSSVGGGAIYAMGSNPRILNNTIKNNSVNASGGFVAAHGWGGAIYLMNSDAIIEYNLISDNELYVQGNIGGDAKGGGIYSSRSNPSLVGNTISNNSVDGFGQPSEGGGIYLYQSYPTLVNNILWNDLPGEIYFSSDGNPNSIMVAYSNIQGGQSAIVTNNNGTVYWQEGNISSDPMFVDSDAADYHLQESSPAIDAGIAFYEWEGEVLVDLSSDQYNGSAPDMGAYEFGGSTEPNESPVAVASANPDHGSAPLTVQFNSDESYDPDGTISSYFWDFDDGSTSSEPNLSHTYSDTGTYIATLTVTDDDGASDVDDVTITVRDGTTLTGGNVSGTWTVSGSPYRIEGNVVVPAGETLTIEPGVTVLFMSWYKFTVNGTLTAEGTDNDQIIFTPDDNDLGWIGLRFVNASSNSHLSHCLIEYGKASGEEPLNRGGGIYIENSDPLIEYSTIENCRATESGGGIYLTQSNAVIKNSVINSNSDARYGGGIYSTDSAPELIGNTISYNSASHFGSFSAGKTAGGGIYLDNSDATIKYNVITHNTLNSSGNVGTYSRGAGLYISGSEPDLANNTIADNSAESDTGDEEGGALYIYQSDPTLVNSILWNNYPQEVFFSDNGSSQYQSVMFSYSDVQGGQSGIVTNGVETVNWEEGNINSNPLFFDATNNDYNLQEGSPAIDAGTAYYEWEGSVLVDLNSEEYNGLAPDMGALESDFSSSPPENEPPVANASADPTRGTVPLTVQFSSDGSSDTDGTIESYAWDFDDGNSSSNANPEHTYEGTGTFDAVLTVTDDDGASDTDTIRITVNEAQQNDELHVQAQTVIRVNLFRNVYYGVDTVLIVDQNNQPLADATVTATYSGPNSGEASATTGSDGKAVLTTNYIFRPQEGWCFEVTDVTKDGYTYNASANVVTKQCESGAVATSASTDNETLSAYPNPFNPVTTVQFMLDNNQAVSLEIYNVLGKRVRTLVSRQQLTSGLHKYQWKGVNDSGRKLSTGLYFIRLLTEKNVQTKQLLLVK